MNKESCIRAFLSTVLGIGALLFFGLLYPYHMHFQEQYQLFEGTWDYFRQTVAVPGGFADWTGRFFTQFFYYAWGGAATLAVLICAIQLLCWSLSREKHGISFALSFVPAAAFWVFMCNENAMPGSGFAIVFSLATAKALLAIKPAVARRIAALIAIPLTYLACGPVAVIFTLTAILKEKDLLFGLAATAVAAACPFVSQFIFHVPGHGLLTGIHYHRFRTITCTWVWISAFTTLIAIASGEFRKLKASGIIGGGILAATVCAGFFLVRAQSDFEREEQMKYDFMVRMQMWNRLMMTADVKNPDTPLEVVCLNLALGKSGRMDSHMFDYFQNGPEGLLTDFQRDYIINLPTAEAYWHLGMINTAQRFMFESQEAIPDFQKSARIYKRLAETNLVNGDYEVARKYLQALQNTIFYKKWAKQTEALLYDEDAINSHPVYGEKRSFRLKDQDFLFSDRDMDSMLGMLFKTDTSNKMALDYMLGWCLLTKDLDRFSECLSLVNYKQLPKAYQHALLLQWMGSHRSYDSLPYGVTSEEAEGLEYFVKAYKSKQDMDYMMKYFGKSYWLYYYYRYLPK